MVDNSLAGPAGNVRQVVGAGLPSGFLVAMYRRSVGATAWAASAEE
jgi:hypothetical protein